MNGPYAFLSYAREDAVVVNGLKRILELNGIGAWQDRAELHVGDKLEDRIKAAIRESSWLIPIISRYTSRSPWVLQEFMTATGNEGPHADGTCKKKPVYPVVVAEDGDEDPRSVLRTSWFNGQLEAFVNASLLRRDPRASDFHDLIRAIKQNWPEKAPPTQFGLDASPETHSRQLLWTTFPSRFSKLEDRFRQLAWDPKTHVWVVVGLPSSGKSALLAWLQSRCPFATRLDLASDRFGTLEDRLRDVVVEVIMFDNIWNVSAMLKALAAVETLLGKTNLLVVACTPNLLKIVEDRLGQIGVNYAVDHDRGVSFSDTKRFVDAHAKDEAFRERFKQLIHTTTARCTEVGASAADAGNELCASEDAGAAAPKGDSEWNDSAKVAQFLWRRIEATWIPFNPKAACNGASPSSCKRSDGTPQQIADGRLNLSDQSPPEDVFCSSLYDAAQRLQHFGQRDQYRESGLAERVPWKEDYIKRCFDQGLSAAQREAVRCVVRFDETWNAPTELQSELSLLENCGVVTRSGTTFRIADRLFAQHFAPPIVIHHLSDLHCSAQAKGKLPRTLSSYQAEVLADRSKCPHLIVISGDIFGDVGELTAQADVQAVHPLRDWLEGALKHLERQTHPFVPLEHAPRLFIVGGNQDVDPLNVGTQREAPGEGAQGSGPYWSGWRRRKTLAQLFHGLACHPYSETNDKQDLLEVFKVGPLQLALLDSCAYGADDTDKESPAWWLDALYGILMKAKQSPPAQNHSSSHVEAIQEVAKTLLCNRDSIRHEPIGGFLAGICSLLVDGRPTEHADFLRKISLCITDCEPGYVSAATLERLRNLVHNQRHSASEVVRLAVLHHPLGSAPRDFPGTLSELRNAGQVREALASAHVALAMHGHLHMHWVDEFRNPLRSEWLLRTLAAPAFGGKHDNDGLGFNEIRVRWEGTSPRILQRVITRRAGAWVPGRAHEFTPGCYEGSTLVD